jgi:DNA relaxase NicK
MHTCRASYQTVLATVRGAGTHSIPRGPTGRLRRYQTLSGPSRNHTRVGVPPDTLHGETGPHERKVMAETAEAFQRCMSRPRASCAA